MQKSSDYALGESPLAQHVAEKLEGLADGQTLSLSELLDGFTPLATDVYRVQHNEDVDSPAKAKEWMIKFGIHMLGPGIEQVGNGYRLTRPYDRLTILESGQSKRRKLPRREVWTEEQEHIFHLEQAYEELRQNSTNLWMRPLYRTGTVELWVHPDAKAVNSETDLLPKAQFIQLGLDMVANGFNAAFPILVVKEGTGKDLRRLIIDGRHRGAAAQAVKVKVEIREIEETTARRTLLSANTGWRKPLTKVQIAWFSDKWFGDQARAAAKAAEEWAGSDTPPPNSVEGSGETPERIIAAAGTEGVVGKNLQGEVSRARTKAREAGPQLEAEVEKEIMSGDLKSSAAVKRKIEEKTGDPIKKPVSASEQSKTAWKRLGDARSCLNLGIKAMQEGRIGGTAGKPLTLKDWEDRFWETRALLADMEAHVKFLYEENPE